jgi:FKBP-type peptidyl-prolyl cis-trans isomerase SlyD
VRVEAADGYGAHDPALVQQVPRRSFNVKSLAPGMQFQVQTSVGHARVVTVKRIKGDMVTIDGNHPLAGEALNFDVDITAVRDATDEELSHGHVHGPGGHHHHD